MKVFYPSPVANLQAASAAPILIRASKTFTGAANLGATGVNELFTTTGAVLIDGFWVRCTTDLNDTVDGALFKIGVTGFDSLISGTGFEGAFDLDTIDAGDMLETLTPSAGDGWGVDLTTALGGGAVTNIAIVDNIIMTISGQNITGGVLVFYALYRPLSSDGALTLGAGMVAV